VQLVRSLYLACTQLVRGGSAFRPLGAVLAERVKPTRRPTLSLYVPMWPLPDRRQPARKRRLTWYGSCVMYAIWVGRRQQAIRREEGGTFGDLLTLGEADVRRMGFKAAVYGSLAAFVFLSDFLLTKAAQHDRPFLILLQAFSVGLWLVSARAIVRHPQKAGSVLNAVWWAQTVFILGAINLRWHIWATPPQSFKPLPLFVSFIILGFYGSLGAAWWLERWLLKTSNFKRDAAVVLSAFATLVLLGLLLLVCGVSKFGSPAAFTAS
jgi:hypothetical protein